MSSVFDTVNTCLDVQIDGKELVREIAEQIGYGRVIQIAQYAWLAKLMADGSSEASALEASGLVCVWCNTDSRTGKKFKGARRKGAK